MSKNLKGILYGLVASLLGIIIWVFFYVQMELISGFSSLFMVYLFLNIYKKVNPGKINYKVYIITIVIVIIEILIAEFISILFICNQFSLTLRDVLSDANFLNSVVIEIITGLVFLAFTIILYIFEQKIKEKRQAKIINKEISESTDSVIDVKELFNDSKKKK